MHPSDILGEALGSDSGLAAHFSVTCLLVLAVTRCRHIQALHDSVLTWDHQHLLTSVAVRRWARCPRSPQPAGSCRPAWGQHGNSLVLWCLPAWPLRCPWDERLNRPINFEVWLPLLGFIWLDSNVTHSETIWPLWDLPNKPRACCQTPLAGTRGQVK